MFYFPFLIVDLANEDSLHLAATRNLQPTLSHISLKEVWSVVAALFGAKGMIDG